VFALTAHGRKSRCSQRRQQAGLAFHLWEEEWRLRELQEEARKKEEAKQRAFRAEVELWNFCRIVREYIGQRERALESTSLDPGLKETAQEWIAWAKGYVEGLDLLKKGFEIAETGESQPGRIDEDPDEMS
jgi:predicted P-loop ATPase